jgi:bifunctional non-homologous end joining protein LigD
MKKLLREYNRKRDFKITREPSASKSAEVKKQVRTQKKKKLIFVVQEHHASHLHYDFRLELDGVLKSWAVPKGPSMEPGEKRLAMHVEDHPLAYATFHGTIPKGQYGAGEVYIWDKGTWEIDGDAHEGLEKGRIEFKLKGKKLKGNWLLVKTHYLPGKNNSWLLIKRHDEETEEVSSVKKTKKKTTKKVKKLLLKKGSSENHIAPDVRKSPSKKSKSSSKKNSQKNDHWPGFIEPQLPLLVDHPPSETGWFHEMKFDGYRLQAHIKGGVVSLFTRNGHDWTEKFPHIANALKDLDVSDAIIDGEAVVLDKDGKSNFQLLQNSLSAGTDNTIRLFLFDLMYLNGEDLREKKLEVRKELLHDLIPKLHSYVKYSDHVKQKGDEFFKLSCKYELEGIVSKEADSSYVSGRGRLWIKAKCSKRQEFIIGGFTEGKGGRTGVMGALLLGVHDKGKLRYVGKVGTGFNEATLRDMKKKLSHIYQAECPFDLNAPKGKDVHWVEPEMIVEINFSNWTNEKILRNPVFLGIRTDKKPKNITIEKETPVEFVEHGSKKKKASTLKKKIPKTIESEDEIEGEEDVTLSHPDKILFRTEKITKEQIAKYYAEVSDYMIPAMGNRPLSLVRCPNGSEKQCFFQKHPTMGKVPPHLTGFKVKEKNKTETYLALNSYQGLKQLTQLNSFEIHTWNTHFQNLMNPDQIVMDFDPDPDVSFKEVVKAAFTLKKILDKLKLKSFVKLSGGKGIHVHVPFDPDYTWDEVKSFSKALANQMEATEPDKYLSNMSKKLRKGKIFIDYLRNGFGSTAVAPYSLRSRKISAVALPLEWSELTKIKSSDQFTLKKALDKIRKRKKDPWKGIDKVKQKISIL